MQKKILYAASIVIISVFLMVNLFYSGQEYQPREKNYMGLVKLGLAPSAESRMPTDKDVFTDVILTNGNERFALFESRDLSKHDYGETFVIGIN